MKNKKGLTIAVAFLLVAALSFAGYVTYARYVAKGAGETAVDVAKWSIALNGTQVTNSDEVTLNETIDWTGLNGLVKPGKIAPGMSGLAGVTIDPEGTEVAIDFYVKVANNENLTNANIVVNALTAGMCSDGTSSTQELCESSEGKEAGTWTAVTLTKIVEDGAYKDFYKGTIDLPTQEDALVAMTAEKTVFVGLPVQWIDLNTDVANAADTITGITDPTDAKVTFDVIIEQKVA